MVRSYVRAAATGARAEAVMSSPLGGDLPTGEDRSGVAEPEPVAEPQRGTSCLMPILIFAMRQPWWH